MAKWFFVLIALLIALAMPSPLFSSAAAGDSSAAPRVAPELDSGHPTAAASISPVSPFRPSVPRMERAEPRGSGAATSVTAAAPEPASGAPAVHPTAASSSSPVSSFRASVPRMERAGPRGSGAATSAAAAAPEAEAGAPAGHATASASSFPVSAFRPSAAQVERARLRGWVTAAAPEADSGAPAGHATDSASSSSVSSFAFTPSAAVEAPTSTVADIGWGDGVRGRSTERGEASSRIERELRSGDAAGTCSCCPCEHGGKDGKRKHNGPSINSHLLTFIISTTSSLTAAVILIVLSLCGLRPKVTSVPVLTEVSVKVPKVTKVPMNTEVSVKVPKVTSAPRHTEVSVHVERSSADTQEY